MSGTLSTDQLVYTPLRDVQTLALGGVLRQDKGAAIEISVRRGEDETLIAVSRGKNKNIGVRVTGAKLGEELSRLEQPFSVIAPGLAGIPSYEEYKSEGIVRRAAARGDANNVLRNVLWILKKDPTRWQSFQSRLQEIFPDIAIDVFFEPTSDEHIRAVVTRDGIRLPIDSSGTGVLQATQVLAYVEVYKPTLLILDEPDSHLHPDNQRRLVQLLNSLADDQTFQVLMATHSRHLLDELRKVNARLQWISQGGIEPATSFDQVKALLDLGALDVGDRLRQGATPVVILTEDSNAKYLVAIAQSSGLSADQYAIWSYGGCSNIQAAAILGRFIQEHAPGTTVIVHRDRDYLTDEEANELEDRFAETELRLFWTFGVDIESNVLQPSHLTAIYSDHEPSEVEALLKDAYAETRNNSVEAFTNSRLLQATRNRKPGDSPPSAGKIALASAESYDQDTARYAHGKSTLKVLNRLAQERFSKARHLDVASSALISPVFTEIAATLLL